MGPLPSFITSCRASTLGRPSTFGYYFPTKWLPARPMKSYSSPLTIKPARSASGAVFSYNNRYATADRNPTYRILLGDASDEPSDTPLNPLRSFRQAMHQTLYIHDRRRVQSLSTIKHIFKLYTALLGQAPSIAIAISRYINVFAGHYVTKALPPHSEASMYLLTLFSNLGKHEMATQLWDWMVHQDDRYTSVKTYAEAINLAAAGNKSLRVCEELYEEALIRYSDKLGGLILSPGFMLPPQINDCKAVMIKHHLWLAIFYARIRKGDWRAAYLNLDTAFRLWPSAIHYVFLKGVLRGRPVHEGYQVYSLFCQAGAYVAGQDLHVLLAAMARACGDSVDFGLKSDLTKAMLEAILVFVNIKGARLDGRHLECLIRGFLSMLPRQGLESREIDNKLDTAVSSFLSYLRGWFLMRGFKVDIEIYVTVISWSRKLRNKFLFEWALKELRSMGQNVTAPSLRAEYSPQDGPLYHSLLIAAGEFRLPEMVKIAWEFLARCFWRTRFGPSLAHWRHFAAAAKRTGLVPYYNLQLDLFISKGKTGPPRARKADYVSGVGRNDPSYQAMHAENPDIHTAVEAFVEGARAIVGDFDSATSKGVNDISLIRFSIWRWPATVPEEWQRRLYDDLSSKSGVELSVASVLYKDEKAPKSLGVSYRELRYRSWKTINNLLLQAEAFESRNDSRDLSGHSHPVAGFQNGMRNSYARPHHLPWLLEHLDDIEKESNKQYSEEEWREKILNLRSPNYRSP